MATTCVYCHARKGKRPCPALNGLICSACCGENRVTKIACPADCPYLEAGTAYQRQRADEQLRSDSTDQPRPASDHAPHHHGPGCTH